MGEYGSNNSSQSARTLAYKLAHTLSLRENPMALHSCNPIIYPDSKIMQIILGRLITDKFSILISPPCIWLASKK